MIRKTNRKHLVEQIVSQIEELIEAGYWSVGDRIPSEMELIEKFDVSRNTLREAIRALVHAGLLETNQGSGTIVRSTNSLSAALKRYIKKTTLLETLDVRLALEKQAAVLAAANRSEMDLRSLENCIEQCRQAAEDNDRETFIASDIRFHQTIVQSSKNQLLIDLYEPMLEVIYTFVEELMTMTAPFKYEAELHLELFYAIRNHDQDAASAYIENYMNILKEDVVEMMED